MEKSFKSIAVNYGLYLGVILILFTVIPYAIDVTLLVTSSMTLFAMLGSIIVMGCISISKSKKALSGYISFKDAFTSFFITIAIGVLISTVVYYVLFGIVDTAAAEQLSAIRIEKQVELMESFNTPVEAIDATVEKMENSNEFSIGNTFLGLAFYLVLYSVIGLICAAFMKKNPVND